jgi:hypothetical protein
MQYTRHTRIYLLFFFAFLACFVARRFFVFRERDALFFVFTAARFAIYKHYSIRFVFTLLGKIGKCLLERWKFETVATFLNPGRVYTLTYSERVGKFADNYFG